MSYSNKEKAEILAEIYDTLETIDGLKLNDISYISVNCYNNDSYIMGKSLTLQDKFFKVIDFLKSTLEENKREILADFIEESFPDAKNEEKEKKIYAEDLDEE
jgi:hypothetical protein